MPDDNVVKMVDSLAADDNVTAQSAFKDALASKIGTALDGKRQTVAKDWLNAAQDAEAIKDLLISNFNFPKENIIMLTDGDATLTNIRTKLFEVATMVNESDRL